MSTLQRAEPFDVRAEVGYASEAKPKRKASKLTRANQNPRSWLSGEPCDSAVGFTAGIQK